MPRGVQRLIGLDGYLTLALSNFVIIVTCGLSWLWQLARVHRFARLAPAPSTPADLAVVLGFRLDGDRVGRDFAGRLDRACNLYLQGVTRRILIVGGRLGRDRVSEAEAGNRYLLDRHVPTEAILTEEYSRHTIENLRHVRATIGGRCRFLLITSRFHLARSAALAQDLGLRPTLCPAEDQLGVDLLTCLRLCREAWFLHWYEVGRAWSRLTRSRRSLARIT